ncbi:MAG TPA: hypothetical protein VMY41_16365, partial [Thermohalobaculum sp.]|nr:hypothetical protein [Thermohalobaculum sp.]
DVLRDIQTNRANLIHGWLLSSGSSNIAIFAHRDAGGGAVHSIRKRHSSNIADLFISSVAVNPALGATTSGLIGSYMSNSNEFQPANIERASRVG